MKISIFIPTYNSGEILRETLDSVLAQTHRDLEVMCVDDSSTDSGLTWSILQEYAAKDSRLHIFQKPNQGAVPYSWNYIFPHLTGEFTFYMSHDDLLAPDAIEKMVAVAESDPEIDCVLVRMVMFESNFSNPEPRFGWLNEKYDSTDRSRVLNGQEAFDQALDYSLPGFSLWRTDLIRREGMPTRYYSSDDMMHRIWKLRCRKVAFSDALFGYRQAAGAITRGYGMRQYRALEMHDELAAILDQCEFVTCERRDYVIYGWYKFLRQHQAWYVRHRSDYTAEERREIRSIIRRSHRAIGSRVRGHRPGLQARIIALSAKCYPLFRLMARFDKLDDTRF